MDMIRMLAIGVTDKEQLAGCARGQIKRKKEALIKALDGTLAPHHLVQLQMLLQDFDHVQSQLITLETMITEITQAHYSLAYECLDSITGIAGRSAQII
jgi:transposase